MLHLFPRKKKFHISLGVESYKIRKIGKEIYLIIRLHILKFSLLLKGVH